MSKISKPNTPVIEMGSIARPNIVTPANYKEELTAFYNDVEEAIIVIFGSYERAAEWFDADAHATELNSLFGYCEEKYVIGWSASRAANEWCQKNVKTATTTSYPLVPAAAITYPKFYPATPILYTSRRESPIIEPEVLIARDARAKIWSQA